MGAIVSTPDASQIKNGGGAADHGNEADGADAKRRARIFEKSSTVGYNIQDGAAVGTRGEAMKNETKELLTKALADFFFLEKESSDSSRMDLVLNAMEHEIINVNGYLLKEGEAGDKMYVLEEGDVQVTINNVKVRQMGKGALLGELALLYDAPRSATVRCLTQCEVWSLRREVFKKIQALAASASLLQRSKWVYNVPELKAIGSVEVSKIVRTMIGQKFKRDDVLLSINELTNRCFLIEKGEMRVQITEEFARTHPRNNQRDKALGIYRPKGGRRTSTADMNAEQLQQYMQTESKETRKSIDGGSGERDEKDDKEEEHMQYHIVHAGCFLGLGPLKGKAGLPEAEGAWSWVPASGNAKAGARCPVTITASNDVQVAYFTVDAFERLLGNASDLLVQSGGGAQIKKPKATADLGYMDISNITEINFDPTRFRKISILGRGSFGVVTLEEYCDTDGSRTQYACKALNKATVIETGQLRHVIDERRLLKIMNSNFIIKLFGTFQTNDTLNLVQEALMCGDLWAVLYENQSFLKAGGLPPVLSHFYTVCIVLALAHIHGKGIAYRDLKPENIMLDSHGYIRIIDFGFAKKIPFEKVEANGETKMHLKSYTLCGTPEYLSPEFIFNAGHDNSADLWALGVMIYEMYMGVTPFAPRQAGNMTDLFTRIATVKRCGLILPNAIDVKDSTPHARNLIEQLLKAEPSERIGVQEGDTSAILDHPFFANTDIERIKEKKAVPIFIAPTQPGDNNLSNLPQAKPYTGDQHVFDAFNGLAA